MAFAVNMTFVGRPATVKWDQGEVEYVLRDRDEKIDVGEAKSEDMVIAKIEGNLTTRRSHKSIPDIFWIKCEKKATFHTVY